MNKIFRLTLVLCLVALTDLSASNVQLVEFSNYTKYNFNNFVLNEPTSDSNQDIDPNLYVKIISSDDEKVKMVLKDKGRYWGHDCFLMDVFLQVDDIQTKYAVILYNADLSIKLKLLESFEGDLNLEIETNSNGIIRHCVNGELRPEDDLYYSESKARWYSSSHWENRVKALESRVKKLEKGIEKWQKDYKNLLDQMERERERERERSRYRDPLRGMGP